MAASQNGGYSCKFMEQPKELQTECIICLCILREPHIVNCCGIKFCNTCINAIIQQNRPCPHCQTRQFTTMADKQLKRQLEERKVFCANKQRGCKWSGELKKLPNHLNENNTYLSDSCEYQDIPCPRCRIKVQRKSMPSHTKNTCMQRDIPCIYEYAGCKDKVRRNTMDAHVQNKTLDHSKLLNEYVQRLANDLRNANDTIAVLRREIDTLKDEQKKLAKIDAVEKDHKVLKAAVKYATLSIFFVRGLLIAISLLILGSIVYFHIYLESRIPNGEKFIATAMFGGILMWLFMPNILNR